MHDYSSILAPVKTVDSLTQILCGLRLDGVDYERSLLTGDWSFYYPSQEDAYFHFVAGKTCWFSTKEGEWSELVTGDAVLLPQGSAHMLASSPEIAPIPFRQRERISHPATIYSVSALGTEPAEISMLFCGSMRFNLDSIHPLMEMMPQAMRAKDLMTKEPIIPHLIEAMISECTLSRVGAGGILARLADVMAAQIIRAWIEISNHDSAGWITAVRDPQVGKVLAAIHSDPGHDWNVEKMARVMGASRSSFAEKFTGIVGKTPARYIAEVRMHQARVWISRDGMRITEVAYQLGYDSEASFSRAFKRIIGIAPSRVRFNGNATASETGAS
ncbi:AraC family transcriptional regulator [Enterobacter cancerogenus]|uniref:AraC family transcriptional regulator n=1 Tax=Enterobacter cancerogenus TaxID=69218 RepID=UPI000C9A44CC|nr:AraC family transcriptional regulator [Enterobacter cancerogenus]PNF12652.1 AraC family transcriptional regulator [Enterobacter cancerogenus]